MRFRPAGERIRGTSTLYSIRIQANWKKSESIELINNDVRIFLLSLLERGLSKWGELHARGSGWQAVTDRAPAYP